MVEAMAVDWGEVGLAVAEKAVAMAGKEAMGVAGKAEASAERAGLVVAMVAVEAGEGQQAVGDLVLQEAPSEVAVTVVDQQGGRAAVQGRAADLLVATVG